MILYRPVGLQELELIYDSGMQSFPARLTQQPIFYPVLDLDYARQVAADWNTKNGQFAGYVTQFKVEDEYISQFEEHTVGESRHRELWIQAEEMEEFNRHIVGHIKVLEAHFGEAFQGFIPEKFGLQGKNAVEQFSLLANTFVYKRMEFYLEIKRNHKTVFLNFPFWQEYDFQNPGLKQKTLQAIKEAWFTSFPRIPLPLPPQIDEEPSQVEQTSSPVLVDPVQEDENPVEEQSESYSPVPEEVKPIRQTASQSPAKPAREESTPLKRRDLHSLMDALQTDARSETQPESHLVQGVKLGLRGNYHEAIEALSRAVEEDPEDVIARTSLGVAFHRLGEDDRALSCFEAALRIDPRYAEAHYFRANLLHSREDLREAIAGYTLAIGLEPELIEGHQKPLPGDRLTDYNPSPAEVFKIARPARRILDLNRSLASNPRQAQLLRERAAEYSRLGNYEQAIEDYSLSLAIQPDDAGAYHLRGLAYEKLGQLDRAQEDYRQANTLDPQLSAEYLNRGIELGKMGNFRQSLASLNEGIRLAPQNPDGYFNRGMTCFQLGDFEGAIEDFSRAIQLSANDEDAYYWRGISHEQAGHRPQAIDDYRHFLEVSQNSRARKEIEQKLKSWKVEKQGSASGRGAEAKDRHNSNRVESETPSIGFDLYDLIVTLGERSVDSIWLGSGVECEGEGAEELLSLTDQNMAIAGNDLLRMTSSIRQTAAGDFQAFDPDGDTPWIFIRAWQGTGFYIETNDVEIKERLQARFRSAEEVDGASPSYEGLFLRT